MPGPFPGMDPYLEKPSRWPDVHHSLIPELRALLNSALPTGYVARIDERLYVTRSQRNVYPDVTVMRELFPGAEVQRTRQRTGGAVIDSDPAWTIVAEPLEMKEPFIDIVSLEEDETVVTTIEVLSPANKEAGSTGRRKYRQKQREVLQSNASLIEIDLLLTGEHTVAVALNELRQKGTWDYLVCLHRAHKGEVYEVWPVTIRQPLPRIRVPLSSGLPDVIIDLQTAFDQTYDKGSYIEYIHYRNAPSVPLRPEDAVWLDAHLREQRLRD